MKSEVYNVISAIVLVCSQSSNMYSGCCGNQISPSDITLENSERLSLDVAKGYNKTLQSIISVNEEEYGKNFIEYRNKEGSIVVIFNSLVYDRVGEKKRGPIKTLGNTGLYFWILNATVKEMNKYNVEAINGKINTFEIINNEPGRAIIL